MKFNRKKLFLWYVQTEAWRNRGSSWIATLSGWLSINSLKDAFLIGGVAQLTVLRDISIWKTVLVIFILGVFSEIVKIFIGRLDWRHGIAEIQNRWHQEHKINAPFNNKMKDQMEEFRKVLSEITGKDIPNHFNDE